MAKAAAKTETKAKEAEAPAKKAGKMYQGREVEAFRWEGSLDGAPDWVDPNWVGGTALKVPFGTGQPWTVKKADIGDYVLRAPAAGPLANDTFSVMAAAEFGLIYNNDDDPPTSESTGSYRPPQESAATVSDLAKTGALDMSKLTPEARKQLISEYEQRGEQVPDALRDPA